MTFASQAHKTIAELLESPWITSTIRDALGVVAMHVQIIENNRMTLSAGMACVMRSRFTGMINPDTLKLKLSTKLLKRATAEEVKDTILHEIAHLIDYVIRGNSNHDHYWKGIAKAIGCSANTYHNIDRKGLEKTVTRYVFTHMIEGSTMVFKKSSYNKAIRMPNVYRFEGIRKYRGKEIVEEIPNTVAA